jgi:hypothetical protein
VEVEVVEVFFLDSSTEPNGWSSSSSTSSSCEERRKKRCTIVMQLSIFCFFNKVDKPWVSKQLRWSYLSLEEVNLQIIQENSPVFDLS